MTDAIPRALSDAKVRNAKPTEKPFKLADGGGLFLLVQPNGAKLWRYKFRVGGKEGLLAVGVYPDMGLKEAREAHQEARKQVAQGINPVRSKQAERDRQAREANPDTFGQAIEQWMRITGKNLAPLTIRQRTREIAKNLNPVLGRRPVASITRADIRELLQAIEARAPEVSRNCRTYLAGVFEYAMDAGMVDASPVPSSRVLAKRSPKSHAVMHPDRLPQFLRDVEQCGAMHETKIAIQLAILTAVRKNEATGAHWSEFDLDAGEWTIPAERMKARRDHWVPLSHQAVELLKRLQAISRGEFLFPHRDKRNTPMAERTLNMLLLRLGYAGETVHGFRSMFSTHFNQAQANPDVIERCLAHAPADKVRAAYNRHDYKEERRELMQRWADHLDAKRLPLNLAA